MSEERGAHGHFLPGNKFASKYNKKYEKEIVDFFKELIEKEELPTFEEFASKSGIPMSTLWNWAQTQDGFGQCIEICKQMQSYFLQKGGVAGILNPQITKFLLSARHGMSERSTNDMNVDAKGEYKVKIEIVDTAK